MSLEWNYGEALMRLEVGDSFFVPTLNPEEVRSRIYDIAKKQGIPIVCRQALSLEVLGLRTWRVEPEVDTPEEG